MPAVTITAWSDYVCPWCYVGGSELATLRSEFEFEVDWRPFYLRPDAPDSGWALPESIRQRINLPDNPLTARAAKLGITINHRLHVPSSKRAHLATEFARAHQALEKFHHGVLERYWSRGEDLSDWAVLRAVAEEAGLDGVQMEREVTEGRWQPAVDEGLLAAQELGISAVPTFVIGNRFVVQGAQDARVFRQALERLGAPRREQIHPSAQ